MKGLFHRDCLSRSPPSGWGVKPGPSRGCLLYVVQKHRATQLHYDFRLEVGGVMPSWSVPKGPSLDSKVKRLAMPTSDHELEYREFEGVIPAGGYGAGPVMVWDSGTYNPQIELGKGRWKEVTEREQAQEVAAEGLRTGNLKFTLYGEKLAGSFALVRMAGSKGKPAWLLIKHSDEHARDGYDANDHDYSAVSGKSIGEIAAEG